MELIRILFHDGGDMVLNEDEMLDKTEDVMVNFQNNNIYLVIEKECGRKLILNKKYIVGIEEGEESDDD